MSLNEAETRAQLVDPKLAASGWTQDLVQEEYLYRRGRVRLVGDQTTKDQPQYCDYVLREANRGEILAVIEAKDELHAPSSGLQQALGYAEDLGVMFAYSTNGNGIIEHDRITGTVTSLKVFPTPEELRRRLRATLPNRGPRIVNRRGDLVDNPVLTPAYASTDRAMRWYQERAVHEVLLEMLKGSDRGLLSLATGTGKTHIAFNLSWKLTQSGYAHKILFLADRKNLRDQAYNDFGPFGNARHVVTTGNVPRDHDIHFATYQTLYNTTSDGRRVYEQYPADYFDAIIVDECHRSGYGDWGDILDHFNQAFHLGLTATPKRSDSIDTYRYFASENPDADGNPQPCFDYSLGHGIADGFLATYQVHRVITNLDDQGLHIEEEVSRGAELEVPEEVAVRDVYMSPQFEREIVIPDRTAVLCRHLAGKLRTWGVNEKTIVFCVTMEHAALVRDYLQAELGPDTGRDRYAVRIVSEEHDGEAMLEEFQDSESVEPTLATTVDLLTTGVNVPSLRNIVFMKPVGSPTMFKQIIGRGTRLDELTGKEFFRILDYTNATRLLDSWDTPPAGDTGDLPTEGDVNVTGRVQDLFSGDPIVGAAISLRVGMRTVAEATTDASGHFSMPDLPEAPITLFVTARDYATKTMRMTLVADQPSLVVELRAPRESERRVTINNVVVDIAQEFEIETSAGYRVSAEQYTEASALAVRGLAYDSADLAHKWSHRSTRASLLVALTESNIELGVLALVLERPDADGFDLLNSIAFEGSLHSREERARTLEQDASFAASLSEPQRELFDRLMDRYRLAGVDEISNPEVFRTEPFQSAFGGIRGVVGLFGDAPSVRAFLDHVQTKLYEALKP